MYTLVNDLPFPEDLINTVFTDLFLIASEVVNTNLTNCVEYFRTEYKYFTITKAENYLYIVKEGNYYAYRMEGNYYAHYFNKHSDHMVTNLSLCQYSTLNIDHICRKKLN